MGQEKQRTVRQCRRCKEWFICTAAEIAEHAADHDRRIPRSGLGLIIAPRISTAEVEDARRELTREILRRD